MAQIVLAAAGAAVGFAIGGPAGALKGGLLGYSIGGAFARKSAQTISEQQPLMEGRQMVMLFAPKKK